MIYNLQTYIKSFTFGQSNSISKIKFDFSANYNIFALLNENQGLSLTLTSPDGGIGRRAGLKHQWSNPCRFDPGSGYPTKCKCLIFKHLHFSFSFLHHACTTKSAISGQNRYFSKNFSAGPVSFACLEAKLVKVGVNGKE